MKEIKKHKIIFVFLLFFGLIELKMIKIKNN